MDISNEMIAAYAEGSLPEKYIPLVRKHLSEHPDELEEVLLLMDSSLPSSEIIGNTSISKVCTDSLLTTYKTPLDLAGNRTLAKEMPNSYRKKGDILSNITKLLQEII